MELEELREGVISIHTLKDKIRSIGLAIFGAIIGIIGIFLMSSNSKVGIVMIIIGSVLVILAFLSFKYARYNAEVGAGMHNRHLGRR